MEKISKMIKRLCPEGVASFSLGEIADIIRGNRVTKGQLLSNGKYPVISGGVTPMGYLNEYNREAYTITISQYGTAGYVDFQYKQFWANDICYCVKPKENVANRFLWYVLKDKQELLYAIRNTDATPYSMPIDSLKSVEIPLPPLPIQQEIVRVLDSFTQLRSNLEAELATRQKQYEYYRNKLLTFDKDDESVEWKTLGTLFEFKNGLNKDKDSFGKGMPIINYTDVYHKRGLYKKDIKGRVTLTDNEISRFETLKGDVFFTRTSETKEEVGFPSVLLEDIPQCTFSGFILRARPLTDSLSMEYCKYCFFTYQFRKEVIKSATLTTRALTNGKVLSKILIPIPSKKRQQEIVSILDTFESLITNLKQEIEVRKKQYEYYREQLLTF